jgi:hypothetical protein
MAPDIFFRIIFSSNLVFSKPEKRFVSNWLIGLLNRIKCKCSKIVSFKTVPLVSHRFLFSKFILRNIS